MDKDLNLILPGSGPGQCLGITSTTDTITGRPAGARCTKREVDGLEYCLWHMPADRLEEAEEITGVLRCHHGLPDNPCHLLATKGTEPPACKNHGANRGSATSKHGAIRRTEAKVMDRMEAIMAEHGDKLLDPPPVGNPLAELLDLAAEMAAWKNIMRDITIYLVQRGTARTFNGKVGEQMRAEVLLFERAQERFAKILIDITKLGIEARLAQIEQQQVDVVDRALTAALAASGLSLIDQDKARGVLRRELVKAAKAG